MAFSEATAAASLAERRALRKLGTAIEARIKMTPITTRSSISENPSVDNLSRMDCLGDTSSLDRQLLRIRIPIDISATATKLLIIKSNGHHRVAQRRTKRPV